MILSWSLRRRRPGSRFPARSALAPESLSERHSAIGDGGLAQDSYGLHTLSSSTVIRGDECGAIGLYTFIHTCTHGCDRQRPAWRCIVPNDNYSVACMALPDAGRRAHDAANGSIRANLARNQGDFYRCFHHDRTLSGSHSASSGRARTPAAAERCWRRVCNCNQRTARGRAAGHRQIGSEARGSDHHSQRSRTRKAGSGPLSGCGAKSRCSHLPRDGRRRQCLGPVGRPESRLSRDWAASGRVWKRGVATSRSLSGVSGPG